MVHVQLVLVLASLGAGADDRVKVTWDRTPDQQLIYDVHIEPEVVAQLRDGEPILGHMSNTVHDVRFFRIGVKADPRTSSLSSESSLKRDGLPRKEPQIDHGWRVADDGSMEYLIQIREGRLQSLLNGNPIEGEFEAAAGDVRHLYIFVGNGELERANGPSRDLQRPARSFDSASTGFGQDRAGSNSSRPGARDTYGSAGSSRGATNPTIRRDSGHEFDDRAPVFASNSRNGGLLNAPESPNRRPPVAYDEMAANYPPNNRVADSRGADGSDGGLQGNDYSNATLRNGTTNASNRQDQNASPPVNWQGNNNQGVSTPPAYIPGANIAQPGKPSLLLTALGLAVSLGFNMYLAWLAWTFFWRYREVAAELARARTDALNTRQFA